MARPAAPGPESPSIVSTSIGDERWREVDPLFQAALDLPPDERPSFLASACGDDPELRATDPLPRPQSGPHDLSAMRRAYVPTTGTSHSSPCHARYIK